MMLRRNKHNDGHSGALAARTVVLSLITLLSFALSATTLLAQGAPPGDATTGQKEEPDTYIKESSTEINVKNADIAAVLRIFSKKTKRNYILDERVKGKISIYLPGKISSAESIRILDSVLALKGFTSVPIGENLWKVVPSKEAIQSTIPTRLGESIERPTAAMVTRLVQLKFVGADDAKQIVTPLVSSEGLINAYTGTNSLIIIDSEDNITRVVDIIDALDVPSSDRDMTIIPVNHAEAKDIAEKLNEILGNPTESKDGATGEVPSAIDSIRARLRENTPPANPGTVTQQPGMPPMGGGRAGGSTTIAARSRAPKVIADERTNAIIVVADEDTTARIRALISQLDSEVDMSGLRFYVYHCQHASAEELAEVLSGLAGGSGASTQTPAANTTDMRTANTGSRDRGDRFSRTQERLQNQTRTPGRSRSEGRSSGQGVSSVEFGENVSITADPASNSLIVHAGKTDYQKILELLKELDIKPRQVLVEATLLEVGIDDSVATGTEWLTSAGGKDGGVIAKNSFNNDLAKLVADPIALQNFSLAAATSGTLTIGDVTIPTQSVLLTAAQRNSNVNVLSAPTILATDNEQAEIVVGQNIPFIASTSTSGDNLNNTFNQVDRQDVGITLRITPQINSDDWVRLEMFTEVSNVVAATLASSLGPTTTIRTSESVVVAKNNQMVVIGGLMSDDVSDADAGVPYLMDIPVLGHLFRTSSTAQRRTNLLIFITPRVIEDQFTHRETTQRRGGEAEKFIEGYEIEPNRHEVLESDDIDRVTVPSEFEGTKPTTITSRNRNVPADDQTAAVIAPPAPPEESAASTEHSDEEETIELHISPKFPDAAKKGDSGAVALETTAARGNLAEPVTVAIPASGRFVVAQLDNSSGLENLPFPAPASDGKNVILGLVVPDGSSAGVLSFFEVGQRYSYSFSGKDLGLRPIGIFESQAEAYKLFPEIASSWYTLSPYEVMNLGKGPWKREG